MCEQSWMPQRLYPLRDMPYPLFFLALPYLVTLQEAPDFYFPHPSHRISHLFKESWFLYWRMIIRKQDRGAHH